MTTKTQTKNLTKDPIALSRKLFDSVLWDKQQEIIRSVWENKYTAVKSCNSGGKSRIAAEITLLYMLTFRPSRVVTTAPCYDDQTEVLTDFGWMPFKSLPPIAKVAQITKDRTLEFVEPLEYYKFPYKGELIGHKSQLSDFLVTPNHNCIINTKKGLEKRKAEDIYNKWDLKIPRHFNVTPRESDLSLAFCEFLGFWFAEGTSDYKPKERRYRVVITQKDDLEYTEDLLERNGFKYHKYAKKIYPNSPWKGGYNYEIYNKELAGYFRQFKKGARNKELPDFIKFFDKERANAFLKGFIQGDGHIDENGCIRLATSSKRLADDLQFLMNTVGLISNIGIQKNEGYGDCYYLGAWVKRGKNVKTSKQFWYKQSYHGYVYCVKVPTGMILTRRNSRIAISGNTFLQVQEILWKEIWSLHHKAEQRSFPIGGQLNKTSLDLGTNKGRPWDATGISTNEVNRFQGFHSPYLLVILDEALGVAPEIWEAMEGLHPHRVLAIGNPLDPSGNFYNCFQSSLWNKITINGYDCVKWQKENQEIPGLITNDWIQERREEWGDNSPLFQARVLGEFPEDSPELLIQRKWVDACRKKELDENEEDTTRVEAVDVASKHGQSETVFTYRYGHTIKEIKAHKQIPLTQTRDIITLDYLKHKLSGLAIDADGMGEGLDDMLYEKNVPFSAFHGGYSQRALDTNKYKNLRTQFYHIIARKFEKGMYNLSQLGDKEYEILKNQLCSIKVKDHDPYGRMRIETKEDMVARGIRSPDFADSFMMSEYAWWMNKYSIDSEGFSYR